MYFVNCLDCSETTVGTDCINQICIFGMLKTAYYCWFASVTSRIYFPQTNWHAPAFTLVALISIRSVEVSGLIKAQNKAFCAMVLGLCKSPLANPIDFLFIGSSVGSFNFLFVCFIVL